MNELCWLQSITTLKRTLEINSAGLATAQVKLGLQQFGFNRVNVRKKRSLLQPLLSRFRNPHLVLLLVVRLPSAFNADISSFTVIVTMVVHRLTLDFFQQYRAEPVVDALPHSVAVKTSVLRDHHVVELHVESLVPGEIVQLSAGNPVPADGHVIEADDFFMNQSLLSCEPYPVEKHAENKDIPIADLHLAPLNRTKDITIDMASAGSAVFAGTHVVRGSAQVLICVTAAQTGLGDIAVALDVKAQTTAFEQCSDRFGMLILRLTFSLIMFVLLVNLLQPRSWLESFIFALALHVANDAPDLILLKHDLNVLHQAVLEGRRTFGKMMR